MRDHPVAVCAKSVAETPRSVSTQAEIRRDFFIEKEVMVIYYETDADIRMMVYLFF